VAAAAVVVVMVVSFGNAPPVPPPEGSGTSTPSPIVLAPLARIEALPVRVTRESFEAGSFEEARALGLEAYQNATFDSAAAQLRVALDRNPGDPEVSLYLGSAELLLGNPAAAMPPLEVASRAKDAAIQEEALWQLANGWLLMNQGDDALATGRELGARGGVHAAEADSLVARTERALHSR